MSYYGGPRLRDHISREMQDTTGYIRYTSCCWDKGPGQKQLKGKESVLLVHRSKEGMEATAAPGCDLRNTKLFIPISANLQAEKERESQFWARLFVFSVHILTVQNSHSTPDGLVPASLKVHSGSNLRSIVKPDSKQ